MGEQAGPEQRAASSPPTLEQGARRAGPHAPRLAGLAGLLNAAPAVQRLARAPVQRVIRNNGTGKVEPYDLTQIDYYEAQFLDNQINQMRVWSADPADLQRIAEVLAEGPPDFSGGHEGKGTSAPKKGRKSAEAAEKEYVPSGTAELAKAKQIEPYLALVGHLAGEGGGTTGKALSGGHLLSEMKKKYSGLVISGAPSADAPWEGWWSDGTADPKWSSFFPSAWTRFDLVQGLWKSSKDKDKRSLPGGILVTKSGGTFYPWVNKTLAKPALKDMVKPS